MSMPLLRVSLNGSTTLPFAGHCHRSAPVAAGGRVEPGRSAVCGFVAGSVGAGGVAAGAGGVAAATGGVAAVAGGGADGSVDGAGAVGGGDAGAVACGTPSRGRVSVGADGFTATTPTTAVSPSGGLTRSDCPTAILVGSSRLFQRARSR